MYLRYNNISNPGKLATFLYKVFVTKELPFSADSARGAKVLSQDVDCATWMRGLELCGVIKVVWGPHTSYRHVTLGKNLVGYFNESIQEIHQLATQADLNKNSDNIELIFSLLKRLCKLQNIPCDPPDFVELKAFLAKDVEVPF